MEVSKGRSLGFSFFGEKGRALGYSFFRRKGANTKLLT
jgi:hypothetical protein